MFCVRFTTTTVDKGFSSALQLENTTCTDVFQFVSSSDRYDFDAMVGKLCKANGIGMAIALDDIKVIANTLDQIESFLTDFYDTMDTRANCQLCKIWSFALEASDGGLRFFIGDRSLEKAWIYDNLKLQRRVDTSIQ